MVLLSCACVVKSKLNCVESRASWPSLVYKEETDKPLFIVKGLSLYILKGLIAGDSLIYLNSVESCGYIRNVLIVRSVLKIPQRLHGVIFLFAQTNTFFF